MARAEWVPRPSWWRLRALARSELERAIDVALATSRAAAARADAGTYPELERHGICPPARVQDARRRALVQIVEPLALELFVEPHEAPSRAASGALSLRA